MKKFETFFSRHRRIAVSVVFLSFCILGGCIFPAHNLTRPESNYSPWTHLYLTASVFVFWGGMARAMFPKAGIFPILALHLGVTLGGMVFRYLLEFGEVSNTYNFTLPNMALHITAAVIISTLSWLWAKHSKK